MRIPRGESPTLWTYTDDIIVLGVVGAWIAGKIVGFDIPDDVALLALAYAFGKQMA